MTIELPVQWGDQDAFGHVNNTVYFRWYESARIAYLERLAMADQNSAIGLGPILAAIGSNYRRQVRFPDRVIIGSRVTRIGRTSFTMEHAVWSTAQAALVADGHSTVVVFDYAAHREARSTDRRPGHDRRARRARAVRILIRSAPFSRRGWPEFRVGCKEHHPMSKPQSTVPRVADKLNEPVSRHMRHELACLEADQTVGDALAMIRQQPPSRPDSLFLRRRPATAAGRRVARRAGCCSARRSSGFPRS